MKNKNDKNALKIIIKKFPFEEGENLVEEKSFDIEKGKCDIEIGGSFEIFVREKLLTKIVLLIQNVPLNISQIVEINYGDSKKFNMDFSTFALECILRYGE